MKFKEFWPQYLAAHSLPGTRGLHYFASVIGLMCVAEAVITRQPLLLAGIGLGYAIAIGAHRFIELNRPMIRVSAFWGIVADLRMSWLALTGGLEREIGSRGVAPAASQGDRDRMPMTPLIRALLLGIAALGLAGGLLDLDDLFEVDIGLHYPLVQLGGPIAAFAGALILGVAAMARSRAAQRLGGPQRMSAAETSLWQASMALLAFGGLAVAMAELAEHGYSQSTAALSFGVLTSLMAMAPVLLQAKGDAAAQDRIASKGDRRIALAKAVGIIGAGGGFIAAVGMVGLQIGRRIAEIGDALSLGWVLTALGVPPRDLVSGPVVNWALNLPASLVAFAAGLLFSAIAVALAELERKRAEAKLFRLYLDAAQGAGPTRHRADR